MLITESLTVPRRYSIALWFAAGTLGFLLCLYYLSATMVDGHFIPADHDSFYHARRIIDALPNPLRMYQFDPRIHAPEGSWISWPWAYDTMMAVLAKGLMAVTGATDPMTVLVFIAPAWVYVNAGLMLGVSSRLGLKFPVQVLAMLCYTCSSLTIALHRVGMLDHHYVEHSFVLATLFLGLGWFQQPGSRRRAIALGTLLGIAPAFHNGLFILQLPVLITLGCLWWMRRTAAITSIGIFAAALVVSTFLFLLPSQPFRLGMFSFYLHSWFHAYVSVCTAVLCCFLGRVPRKPNTVLIAILLALILAIPIVPQIYRGGSFVLGELTELDRMGEVASIFDWVSTGRTHFMMNWYSGLVWLLPVGVFWTVWRLRRAATDHDIFFMVMTLVGTALLLQQFRLEYFGSFALYLPLCLILDEAMRRHAPRRWIYLATAAAVTALAYLPVFEVLHFRLPPGGSIHYAASQRLFRELKDACKRRPGVVLADHNDGHYVTFHTDCSVISDNFIVTAQDEEKLRLTDRLLHSSFAEALAAAPYVRYVLLIRRDAVLTPEKQQCGASCSENAGLRRELLFAERPLPSRLKLLQEIEIKLDGQFEVYGRLFEVMDATR